MSVWSRIGNGIRRERMSREIDEEIDAHIAEGIQQGRDPDEVRRAFGSVLRQREESRDIKLVVWLDALRADVAFGWRQLIKHRVTSAAAILSLALGVGACTSAFRLIDALLLRPLPIANHDRLYDLSRQEIGWDGKPATFDGWAYPAFRQMHDAIKDQAELIAVSYADRRDLTYKSDREMEKAHVQYVSASMFTAFGLSPALGRLFMEDDDVKPGARAYAVLSYDYWKRRFAMDPKAVGRAFHLGNRTYQIIGVAAERFTGTEPGTVVDIFLPAMMHRSVLRPDSTWHRTLAMLKPGVAVEPLRQELNAISLAFERDRAKRFTNMSQQNIDTYLRQTVVLERAPSGVSDVQLGNRLPLAALGVLVVLVLLIACANVANLMTAQAAARAREMALRVSIGAGRWRLIQLVLVESALLASLAAALGGLFAWWCAPVVVGMINPSDDPVRLILPADWRVIGFGLLLTLGVTLLFGLTPALRASSVKPASALKGGDDPHSRGRAMYSLVAVQAAFCFLVLFVAGLFVSTFQRLTNQPTGFSAERLLTLDTVASPAQPSTYWDQLEEHLRASPGVEKVAMAGWPLLSGYGWNDSVSINGGRPSDDLTYLLNVSPGWIDAMKIPLLAGRDFRAGDGYPGTAIVNETFVKRYLKAGEPLGRTFDQVEDEGGRIPLRIVGVVRDARYRGIRDAIPPVAYVPFGANPTDNRTFIVRTSLADPMTLASTLREKVSQAGAQFRVSNIRSQTEINQSQTVRERLLAVLALFFALVAVLLAGVGLHGVLSYSVLQRRREIGIRIAVGAQPTGIARLVTLHIFSMVLAGSIAGLVVGMVGARYIESLFYQVNSMDPNMLAIPSLTLLGSALAAALPAVIRAVQIDPVEMLRSD